MRIQELINKKNREKISVLTAYNYVMASFAEEAGIDIILVGDSLANVELGRSSTASASMGDMIHHLRAVRCAVSRALIVVDMPYGSFHVSPDATVENARSLIDAGADAVKIEWHNDIIVHVAALKKEGIYVVGHVGLTPQTAQDFKVQGRDSARAEEIKQQAEILENNGCFAVVLECVPQGLAQSITEGLSILTIGIGAGKFCDGQVLVTYDMLGMYNRFHPKFVKQYALIGQSIVKAMTLYKEEVQQGLFPGPEHSFK